MYAPPREDFQAVGAGAVLLSTHAESTALYSKAAACLGSEAKSRGVTENCTAA